jgi:DNA-directed RNA polymerase subunit RPC12/RpoP
MVDTAATSGNDTPPAKQAKLEQSVSPVKQQQNSGAASSVVTEEGEQQQPKQKESVDGMPPNIEAMLAAFQEAQSNKAAQSSQPDLLSLIQQLAKVKSPEPQQQQQEKFNCDKCSQDFSNQSLLLQHQLTQHTVMPSTTPPTSTSSQQQQQNNILNMLPAGFPALPFMLPQLSSNFPTLDMEFGNANSNHPSLNQSSLSKQSAPKRQYSSTTKNYCDLCNKEVCNKYFLRTHMLKMHNIVIDENKTVIANIDTQEKEKEGSVSFRCDVCHLDMKTRTQLKDHKKNVHGIQPVVAPSSASSQISNSSGSKPSSGSAFEFPPTSPSQTTSSTDFKCIRCERDYDSFQSLVGHLHDQHENEVTESEIMELLAKAASTSAAAFQEQQQQQSSQLEEGEIRDENDKTEGEEDEHDDEAMEITREVAMKMVVENQLKIKDDEEMPEIERGESDAQYICNSCGRHYSTQQNLNDHISTVHQYKIRLSPKKESRLILSPSKVNKIIKCFTCAKCNQRFAQSDLCKLHIIQHLRREQKDAESKENENLNGESSSTNVVEEQQHKEVFEDELISSFMREETTTRDKSGTMIEHVVSELSRRGSHGGLAKLPEEKHSHTSGSASPMSVHTMPEAYAQPMPVSSSTDPKPFVLQSFVMREVSNSNAFPTELHAYLPVRNLIDGPIRVTFELQAAPQIDAQIKNL